VATTLSSAPNPTKTNLGTWELGNLFFYFEGSHAIFHPMDVSGHPNQTRTWGNHFFVVLKGLIIFHPMDVSWMKNNPKRRINE
jgi:hypothetical protein